MSVRRILFSAAFLSSCAGHAFEVGEGPDGAAAISSNAGAGGTNRPNQMTSGGSSGRGASGNSANGGAVAPVDASAGSRAAGGSFSDGGGTGTSGLPGSGGSPGSGSISGSGGVIVGNGGQVSSGGVATNTGGSSTGGVPVAGAPGSGGAVTVPVCAGSSNCSYCCDQNSPSSGTQKGSSVFSLALYGCACAACYGNCDATLCNSSTPQPSPACLQCIRDNAVSGECKAEWDQCRTDSVCAAFGSCVFGCL